MNPLELAILHQTFTEYEQINKTIVEFKTAIENLTDFECSIECERELESFEKCVKDNSDYKLKSFHIISIVMTHNPKTYRMPFLFLGYTPYGGNDSTQQFYITTCGDGVVDFKYMICDFMENVLSAENITSLAEKAPLRFYDLRKYMGIYF